MSTSVEDLGIFRPSVSSSFLSRFLPQESVQTPSFNPPLHNPPSLPSLPVISPNPTMTPVLSQFPHSQACPDPSPELVGEPESDLDPRRVARSVVAGFLLEHRPDLPSDFVSSHDIAVHLYTTGKISPMEEEYLLRLTSDTSPLSEHDLEPLITVINGALLDIEADTKAVTTYGVAYMKGKPRVHVLAVNDRASLTHELLPLSLPFHHLSLGHLPSEDDIEKCNQEIMKIMEKVDKLEVYQFPGLRRSTARV